MDSKALDQFYTKPELAKQCIEDFAKIFDLSLFDLIIEPSAGSGSFYSYLPQSSRVGLDIDPKHPEVILQNFLEFNPGGYKRILTIGNPPFGHKSELAMKFFQKASLFSEVIAFIVPIQWKKWHQQKKISKEWSLVSTIDFPFKSFLFEGREYGIRCCFQIWEKNSNKKNLRIEHRPAIRHKDFKMYLYNRTEFASKYYHEDWDFAVPRQGYVDYTRKEFNKENCERTVHWMFFKGRTEEITDILLSLDFSELALRNTSRPGFGKADVISFYEEYLKKKKT